MKATPLNPTPLFRHPELCGEVHPETAPLQAVCSALRSTEQSSFWGGERKGEEDEWAAKGAKRKKDAWKLFSISLLFWFSDFPCLFFVFFFLFQEFEGFRQEKNPCFFVFPCCFFVQQGLEGQGRSDKKTDPPPPARPPANEKKNPKRPPSNSGRAQFCTEIGT